MVGQPHRNFMKMASWSSVSEHLVNPIGMSDQLKWNNQTTLYSKISPYILTSCCLFTYIFILSSAILYPSGAVRDVGGALYAISGAIPCE